MQDQIVEYLIPILALIYSAGFLLLWTRAREQIFILALVFSGVARAVGFFAGSFFFDPASLIGELFPFLCFGLGVTAMIWAICERCGQRSQVKLHLTILAVGLALATIASMRDNFLAETIIRGSTLGLIVGSGAQTLLNSPPRNVFDRIITWMTVIYSAQFFVRPALALIFDPELSTANYGDSAYHAVVMLNFAVMTILQSTVLIIAILIDQFRLLEEKSQADPLTGLKVRRAFEETSVVMLDKAAKNNIPVAMIVADIDHFKQVNDIWGHQAGDAAIAAFGKLIESTVRSVDLCGRIGGEEFCVLVRDCEEPAARKLAERIRLAFERMEHAELGREIRLTASFGVSCWREGEGYGRLFARADAALYSAKESGRNRVVSESDDAYTAKRERRTADRRGGVAMRAAG